MTDPAVTEAARALAARRPTTVITCEVCGAERVVVIRSKLQGATCSRKCGNHLAYLTRKAAKNA